MGHRDVCSTILLFCLLVLPGCREAQEPEAAKPEEQTQATATPEEQPAEPTVEEHIPLELDYPEPGPGQYEDPHYGVRGGTRLADEPPAITVPKDATNVALGKPVSSSNATAVMGELKDVTNGDKRPEYWVGLEPNAEPKTGPLHITIDLQREYEIYALAWWHSFDRPIVCRDVVIQIARDPEITDAIILFNNDRDNSLGLGQGADLSYVETNEGWRAPAGGVIGRYVRLHSRGNSRNLLGQYTEVEVYGRPPSRASESAK